MYLTRITMPISSDSFRLSQDFYSCRETFMKGFPRSVPVDERPLFCVQRGKQGVVVTMQTKTIRPTYSDGVLPKGARVSHREYQVPDFKKGWVHPFTLRANPTFKVLDKDGRRRRVGVKGEDNMVKWLCEKGAKNGFFVEVESLVITPEGYQESEVRKTVTFLSVLYKGYLTITDPEAFRNAWVNGIGSSKAFGCGLLMLGKAVGTSVPF